MNLPVRLFAVVILVLLPIVGIEIYDEIDLRARRADEGKDQALRLVRLVANEQSKVVAGARQILTALGKTPAVRNRDVAACSAFLADLSRSFPQYRSLFSIDLDGHPVCVDAPTAADAFLGDRPYFKLALADRGFAIGEYEVNAATGQKAIYVAQPYRDTDDRIAGVVAVGLGLDWLNHEIARSPLPPKATVSVIDRQGTILARYPGSEQFVGTKIAGQSHAAILKGGEGVQEAPGFDGVTRIYAYTQLPGGPPGLTLSVGLDKGELFKGSTVANQRDIAVIAGSCVLALILAAIGAQAFISRPIRTLLDAAEQWRKGDLDARVSLRSPGSEFGRLGTAFNAMAAAMGAREQELEQRVRARTDALQVSMKAQQVAEAALYDSRKMETVGRLTGGIAHDFNNLLAAIVGNIELARARIGGRHAATARLDAAMQSASRGAALIQQLLAFARRQTLHPQVVDVNRHIRTSQAMLQRLLRSDVTVETRLSAETWLVRVDPNQLEAAILNLAINARDAMPAGGTLRLETRNVAFSGDSARCDPGSGNTGSGDPGSGDPGGGDPGSSDPGSGDPGRGEIPGDFVALTVSDTGTGIPPELLEKVFEPFYTTKEIGAGSGLGLSMIQGFVRQSAGFVAIESVVGRGTSVTLYLPRTTGTEQPVSPRTDEPITGEGCILLVDDDDEVRSVTAQLLELSGYTVTTARNANEAVACFQSERSRIDLLVTDLVMADGLNGLDLASAIRGTHPDLPVLLITGYSDALLEQAQHGGMPVLTKPFEHAALTRAIRQALGARAQSVGPVDPVQVSDCDPPGAVMAGRLLRRPGHPPTGR